MGNEQSSLAWLPPWAIARVPRENGCEAGLLGPHPWKPVPQHLAQLPCPFLPGQPTASDWPIWVLELTRAWGVKSQALFTLLGPPE